MPEQRVDEFRTATLRWLFGSAAGLGAVALAIAGFVLLIATGRPLVLLVPALAGLAVLLHWLAALATTFEVTDQRLILRRGLLLKTIDEIELYRIKDIRLDYSLLNQLADIGTITLTSTDRTTGDTAFRLRDVPQARDRREGLRGLVERARQRRGVREVDVDHEGHLAGY